MCEQCEVSPSKLNGKFSAMGVLRHDELNSRNYEDGCLEKEKKRKTKSGCTGL